MANGSPLANGHVCGKEREWGEVTTTIEFFMAAEKRREEREERIAVAVEKVAEQGETIKALVKDRDRFEVAHQEGFRRIRDLEDRDTVSPVRVHKLERQLGTLPMRVWASKSGTWLLVFIVIGFGLDCVNNFELIKKILSVVKYIVV